MITTSTITTAEQLLKAGDIGRCELIRGELNRMSPSGFQHTVIAAKIAQILLNHVEPRNLGVVAGAEGGFIIERNPDTVRAPDAAFVRSSRARRRMERGFFPGPPDIAVEVLSPNDTASEVLDKVQQWLKAGTVAVWIIDPDRQTIAVHCQDQPVRVYGVTEDVIDEDLLPGLRMAVKDVFAQA